MNNKLLKKFLFGHLKLIAGGFILFIGSAPFYDLLNFLFYISLVYIFAIPLGFSLDYIFFCDLNISKFKESRIYPWTELIILLASLIFLNYFFLKISLVFFYLLLILLSLILSIKLILFIVVKLKEMK